MNALRLRPLRIAALTTAVALSFVPSVPAQDSASTGSRTPQKLEAFVVTGSLIKRTDFAGPSPIHVVTRDDIERVAGTGLADVLRQLPEVTELSINEHTNLTAVRGATALDLRSLGASNTLVLVDGRRQAPNGISAGSNTFVDINRFPSAMIERVEVLKDGASAVYGADATAGVVNLILRKEFEGTEVSGRYGNYLRTDGAESSWSLVTGRSRGAFHAMLGLTYSTRNAVAATDLPFTANADQTERWRAIDPVKYASRLQPSATATSSFDGRSPFGPFALVFVPTAAQLAHPRNGLTTAALLNPLTGLPSTFLPGTGGLPRGTLGASQGTAASVPRENNPGRPTAAQFVPRAFMPGDLGNSYNFQPFVWNTSETERTGVNLRLGYEYSPRLSVHASAGWMRQESVTHAPPAPMATGIDNAILVPASNYYNPFGIPLAFSYRSLEVGPRIPTITSDSLAVTLGLQGSLRERFDWDLGWSYSSNESSDLTTNYISESALRAALAKGTPDALNVFGGLAFRNDPATLESIRTTVGQSGSASTALADLRISTAELFSLPWGAVGASASFEHRLERFNITNDPRVSTLDDIVGASRRFDRASARRAVQAAAAELRLPLLSDAGSDWLHSAELSVAARFERFSEGYNSGVKPFAGLRVRVGSGLLLRASYGEVFRAPSLPQLYGGTFDQYLSFLTDLRRPPALTGDTFDDTTTPRLIRTGGNPLLTPEQGTTRQAGFVFDVPVRGLRGLSLEFTHGQIEQHEVIRSELSPVYLLQNELAGVGDLVIREPGTTTYTNRTSAPIPLLSGPAGATTALQPGQSASVPGRITLILDTAINVARQVVRYDDFGLRYQRTLGGLGRFTAASNWTYYEFYSLQATSSAARTTSVGRSIPRYRSQSSLTWQRGRWGADAALNYLHRYRSLPLDGFEVGRFYTVNLGVNHTFTAEARWRPLRGVHLSLGIENLLDREPPPDNFTLPYNPGFVGRPAGRYVFVAARRTF